MIKLKKNSIKFKSFVLSLVMGLLLVLLLLVFRALYGDEPEKLQEVEPVEEKEVKVVEFAGIKIDITRQDLFERYDRERIAYCYSHTSSTLILKRSERYFPVIEPILKKYGIHDDFKYMAVVESALDPRAVSPVKAAGLWQFMEGTGRQYGLEINDEVDERFHVEKSTEAFCRYMKAAYKYFDDWFMASASYNVGIGRLERMSKEQQINNFFDLYLNQETSRYVFRMLVVKEFFSNPEAFGFNVKNMAKYPKMENIKTVVVDTTVNCWTEFAAQYNCTYAQLKEANFWIKGQMLTNEENKTYIVKIPEEGFLKEE